MQTPIKPSSIPILLVEDNLSDIEIIRRALQKGGLTNPLHLARDGQEAIDLLQRGDTRCGVLILDIHLPKINGIEVLKSAKQIDPDVVVIMLTSHASLETAVQSLRREGAFDYIQKSKDDPLKLIETIRLALEKRSVSLQSHLILQAEGNDHIIDMLKVEDGFGLSKREVDVVKWLCRGHTNKEIAEKLFISNLTVKAHLKNIYEKMQVHNRTALFSKLLTKASVQP
ncbi:MAG: LuxR C-terminal-related transcriptional regulator [Nitrospiria bacterium]